LGRHLEYTTYDQAVGHLLTTVLGFDIQSIDEVATSLEKFGTRYTRRLYTCHEVECCGESPSSEARSYAERFAAKEAVLKLLDVREVIPSWKDIEVRRTARALPEVVLYGVAAELASQQGIGKISLSISHDGGFAVAIAVAEQR
jgi:holo-[acyl-carrier protein] synthase